MKEPLWRLKGSLPLRSGSGNSSRSRLPRPSGRRMPQGLYLRIFHEHNPDNRRSSVNRPRRRKGSPEHPHRIRLSYSPETIPDSCAPAVSWSVSSLPYLLRQGPSRSGYPYPEDRCRQIRKAAEPCPYSKRAGWLLSGYGLSCCASYGSWTAR